MSEPGSSGHVRSNSPSAELSISYSTNTRSRGVERKVVYLRYGNPPVTNAEVEIMHQHLEVLARRNRDSALMVQP